MNILEVNNISKSYITYSSEFERIKSWFNRNKSQKKRNLILNNINFTVLRGESVGIIGKNGAGKSTILKLITGVNEPSQGEIRVFGKISSILELGIGFNDELTGRQNTTYTAGLMGIDEDKIQKVISSVEEFSEIGAYFDKPLRIYSTGMKMRIAFSIATAIRPEILIIDEILSVGDAYFVNKCFEKIRDFQNQGTSIILVSHDFQAIKMLCSKTILIDNGSLVKYGNTEEVIDHYNALLSESKSKIEFNELENLKVQTVSGSGEAVIEEVKFVDKNNELVEVINVGDSVKINVRVKIVEKIDSLVLGFSIKDRFGQVIFGTNTWHTSQVVTSPQVGISYLFCVKLEMNVGVGTYTVQLALVDKDTHLTKNYHWIDMAVFFEVINNKKSFFIGNSWLKNKIEITNG